MDAPSPSKASPPRRPSGERDPERTRATILAAAMEEFTAHGLNGARVDEIAKRSGVNKRMIYYYFGDKSGVYLAVLDQIASGRSRPGRCNARTGRLHLELFHRAS